MEAWKTLAVNGKGGLPPMTYPNRVSCRRISGPVDELRSIWPTHNEAIVGPELNKISIGTGKLNVGSEDLGRGKEENERNNNYAEQWGQEHGTTKNRRRRPAQYSELAERTTWAVTVRRSRYNGARKDNPDDCRQVLPGLSALKAKEEGGGVFSGYGNDIRPTPT